jgi:Skp family chaperone for outer membrane proteins
MPMRTIRALTILACVSIPGVRVAAAQTTEQASLFPKDSRIAFVDFNQVATTSVPGKELLARLKTFRDGKLFELNEKQKQLDGLQTRLQTGGSVLNESARAQLAKDIDRMKREIQFASEDAQAQLGGMEQDGLADLRKRITPILKDLATERHLDAIFSTGEAGASYVDPRVDLSAEVTKRLDAAAAKK